MQWGNAFFVPIFGTELPSVEEVLDRRDFS